MKRIDCLVKYGSVDNVVVVVAFVVDVDDAVVFGREVVVDDLQLLAN